VIYCCCKICKTTFPDAEFNFQSAIVKNSFTEIINMKKLLFLITVAGIATITSCSKASSPVLPSPPPAPTLFISVSPNAVWYSETSAINWITTNTDSVQVDGVKVSGSFFVTPSLTTSTTYTIKAFGPGGSVTTTVRVNVWSQNMTLLCKYGNWKNIYSVSYKLADSLNPALYNYFPIDTANCKIVRYLTEGFSYMDIISGYKGQIMVGCINTAVTGNFTWYWEKNETQISYEIGPSINWDVDTLNASLFRISQNRPDTTFPGIVYHYVLRFVHG